MSLFLKISMAAAMVGCVAFSAPPQLYAHPFHTTTAEMEFNSQSGRFEVSLRLLGSDLETAVASFMRERLAPTVQSSELKSSPIVTGNSPTLELKISKESLLRYLQHHFQLRSQMPSEPARTRGESPGSGNSSIIYWVGQEQESSWVWLYFEVEPPASKSGWSLTNQLLMDINEQQVNTCLVRYGEQRASVKTESNNRSVVLPLIFHK